MRRSIRSSFFIKASSPSAAQALLQLKIDIAVAASSVLRQQRSDLNIDTGDTGKRRNWCNDMGPPKSAEIEGSATSGAANTVRK
jgi:hypothetical protein